MIQLDLQPEIEAELFYEATAQGLAVGPYVEAILTSRPLKRTRPDPAAIAHAIAGIRNLRETSQPGPESIKDLINEGRKY